MNWSCCLLPIVLATIFGAVQADVLQPPTVKTKNGLIAGYVKSLDEGKTAYVYEGIPYGELVW